MTFDRPREPVSRVSKEYIRGVQSHHGKFLIRIGTFDLVLLGDLLDIIDSDTSGEIELYCMPVPNKAGAGLLVAEYEGNYAALSGIRDNPQILSEEDTRTDGEIEDDARETAGCDKYHYDKENPRGEF